MTDWSLLLNRIVSYGLLFTINYGPMNPKTTFKKRLGKDPKLLPELANHECSPNFDCPDMWELENGDFAVIGLRKTTELKSLLPESAHCGEAEEIVVIPRVILLNAKQDIPNQ